MNKVNYQKMLDELLLGLQKEQKVPSLLLHSCCAPCSSYVIEYLSNYFYITVFYYNPNIDEKEEYLTRASEQRKFIDALLTKYPVRFREGPYDTESYTNTASPLADEKEGGARCFFCYEMRLQKTAEVAKTEHFDYFATTLTISPLKNAAKLNEIGEKLSKIYQVAYLYSDFKKKEGYKRSTELSIQYQLYRQDYCGCSYSKRNLKK